MEAILAWGVEFGGFVVVVGSRRRRVVRLGPGHAQCRRRRGRTTRGLSPTRRVACADEQSMSRRRCCCRRTGRGGGQHQ